MDFYHNDIEIPQRKQEKPPLWDSFQDPPPQKDTGSSATWNKLNFFLKAFKFLTYIFVCLAVLGCTLLSKSLYLLMASNVRPRNCTYCNSRHTGSNSYSVIVSDVDNIAWTWALIFAFSAPEVFTFLRALRICVFKDVRYPSISESVLVVVMEILHVIGLAIFTFLIIPNMTSGMSGLMLTNCMSFIPAVLCVLTVRRCNFKSIWKMFLFIGCLSAQISGLIAWPLLFNTIDEKIRALIPVALILISFRWWENYTSGIPLMNGITQNLRRTMARYRTYIYLSPLKMIVFALLGIGFGDYPFWDYFTKFTDGWQQHSLNFTNSDDYEQNNQNQWVTTPQTSTSSMVGILLIQISASYVCYILAKFVCKVQMQIFSFSFPLGFVGPPLTIGFLIILSSMRASNSCAFQGILPNYLFFVEHETKGVFSYFEEEKIWLWLVWWVSQLVVTYHIWFPDNKVKNLPTEKLFVCPWYCGFLVDQCITMNRRRAHLSPDYQMLHNKKDANSDVEARDRIPQLIICATMWHETEDEMIEFLKSIIRLDEDQCARRMAKNYLFKNEGYYELETNIFFDDAFELEPSVCADPKYPPLNEYVKTLITLIEKAAQHVYGTKIKIKPPIKTETPYGGRLTWILPGRNRIIAHLKNKDEIRHKKRWSQVMYMYYILGFRIMDMKDVSRERKAVIAENTFLLALDGDIDFQPRAVQLLVDRMIAIEDLGAACGRIHPVGRGPMVWYQIFEYAIGHWLQKATEHVIGCVLCSPGCFSLFRGSALMEDSVMKKYTTVATEPRHYVQYDQGEDRWLCTLILKQGKRVEYSAASDAYTHSPESFNEFYNQRRRWVPSTIANIMDLLMDAELVVNKNNSISMPYIWYQAMLMVGTILGPGTIFLMMVGSLVTVFSIDIWTSFLWNFFPLLIFIITCLYFKQKYQLMMAFIISAVYCLVMMAVLIGIIIQMLEDGILSPASLFFLAVALQIVIAGLMHPQEATALFSGFIYYITIPSMYMLLMIYSVFNMNDVSWGTREKKPVENQNTAVEEEKTKDLKSSKFDDLFGFFRSNKDTDGSFDFSCAGLFRCILCTNPKSQASENQLYAISSHLDLMNKKIETIERHLTGEIKILCGDDNQTIVNQPDKDQSLLQKQHQQQEERDSGFLPKWLDDPCLDESPLGEISSEEKRFWKKLIEKYLHPLFDTKEEKAKIKQDLTELRNMFAFAFIMLNALFVLIVFLLQLKKEDLHLQWPINPKNTITYDATKQEVLISREYLELDPIGISFVVFFGVILLIQFIAMFFHRFATLSQLLATTKLTFFGTRASSNESVQRELKGNAVEIAKACQRPQTTMDDEEEFSDYAEGHWDDEGLRFRKSVIHKLHAIREKENNRDWSDLEQNFLLRYLGEEKINWNNIQISRHSIIKFNKDRETARQSRRNTVLHNRARFAIEGDGIDNIGYEPDGFY